MLKPVMWTRLATFTLSFDPHSFSTSHAELRHLVTHSISMRNCVFIAFVGLMAETMHRLGRLNGVCG